jgi:hypothetical protein
VVLGIQKQCRENLVFEASQLGDQVLLDQLWRREGCASLSLLIDHLASGIQDLLSSGRQVTTVLVTNHQGSVKGERKLRHDRAPVARAELPGTGPSTALRSSQGGDSRPRRKRAKRVQPLTARTP